ncbi:MAG: DUF362 domain-containing protein [Planctomycetes bacterium]|nr:DUF362 domain-containing protein [Planctomycetota bacterium]
MTDVSIIELREYGETAVLDAMRRCLEPLGGMKAFVRPGQKVLLKPNLLGGFEPDRAVTTHPDVVRAVAILVSEVGGAVSIGDSPGVGALAKVLKRTGVATVIEQLGAAVADFEHTATCEDPSNRVARRIELAKAVADADVIITLPKLKTHVQMGFTGAIKNQYGLIVGAAKARYHFRLQDREWLAGLIVEINRLAKPALAIMDAVIGMEGEGPSSGDPRDIGLLLAGANLAAVDCVACHVVGIDPESLPLMRAAKRYGFGTTDLAQIRVHGPDWKSFQLTDFKTVAQPLSILRLLPMPDAASRWMRRHIAPGPAIIVDRCVKCEACAKGCPVEPPAIQPLKPRREQVDHRRCIRCYCCHEFCPVKAIELQTTWLLRVFRLHRLMDWFARNLAGLITLGRRRR